MIKEFQSGGDRSADEMEISGINVKVFLFYCEKVERLRSNDFVEIEIVDDQGTRALKKYERRRK